MDATICRCGALLALLCLGSFASAGQFATANFVVSAPTDDMARQIAKCAEYWREDLAVQWLGKKLPNWSRPCPIDAKVGQMGAGGQTTFTFEGGEVFGWKMQVQGTLERVLDSVIPHEVNHTIFASYFRRPLPRWADEGAATLFEHESERARQTHTLSQVIQTSRRIPLKQLLAIKEYPADQRDVLTLYAEGYSLASFLVGKMGETGRTTYLKFLAEAHTVGWEKALKNNYGHRSIDELEKEWSNWFLAGSPEFTLPKGHQLAQADQPAPRRAEAAGEIARGQSPELNDPPEFKVSQIPALAPTSRELRVGRVKSESRGAEVAAPEAVRNPGAEEPEPLSLSRNLRPRVGEDPTSRPSLPPASLSPTADGLNTNPRGKAYSFPEARGARN